MQEASCASRNPGSVTYGGVKPLMGFPWDFFSRFDTLPLDERGLNTQRFRRALGNIALSWPEGMGVEFLVFVYVPLSRLNFAMMVRELSIYIYIFFWPSILSLVRPGITSEIFLR